jgi:hypothetical protein
LNGSAISFTGTAFNIGTVSQNATLSIAGQIMSPSDTSQLRITAGGIGNGAGIVLHSLTDGSPNLIRFMAGGGNTIEYEQMSIRSGGEVGIGTSAPGSKLHVIGAGRFGSSIADSTNAVVEITNNATIGSIQAFVGNSSTTKSSLCLNAYGGNVGIGTATPLAKLTVSNVTATNQTIGQIVGEIAFMGYGRANRSASIQCVARTSGWDDSGALVFGTNSGSTSFSEKMCILENGNVGIGTTAPARRLTVSTGNTSYGISHIASGIEIGTYIASASLNAEAQFGTITNHKLGFFTNGGSPSVVLSGSNLGIGTSSPGRKLHVSGNGILLDSGGSQWGLGVESNHLVIKDYSDAAPYLQLQNTGNVIFGSVGGVGIGTATPGTYKLYVNGSIFASSGTITGSDMRIKQNIVTADTATALNQINALRLARYDYVDKNAMANENTVYGVIAQEVQEVLPEAVRLMTNIIPNVMQTSKSYTVESIKYKDPEPSTSNNETPVESAPTTEESPEFEHCVCVVEMDQPHGFTEGVIVRIVNDWSVDGVDNEITIEVPIQVIDEHSFRFTSTNKTFTELSSVFVYGNQVDDFHAVDKSKLFMPLIGAVQELTKKNDEKTTIINDQSTRINALESALASVLARLDALESKA